MLFEEIKTALFAETRTDQDEISQEEQLLILTRTTQEKVLHISTLIHLRNFKSMDSIFNNRSQLIIVMLRSKSAMDFLKSFNFTIPYTTSYPLYTTLFNWLHNQKSHGFRSDKSGGHGLRKKRLITRLSVKCWSNCAFADS